jgi:hypothetical protein
MRNKICFLGGGGGRDFLNIYRKILLLSLSLFSSVISRTEILSQRWQATILPEMEEDEDEEEEEEAELLPSTPDTP